jgi:hypothetical protein
MIAGLKMNPKIQDPGKRLQRIVMLDVFVLSMLSNNDDVSGARLCLVAVTVLRKRPLGILTSSIFICFTW